jgi:hypothetical protein
MVWRKFVKWLKSSNATLTELNISGSFCDKIAILMSMKENKYITKLNFEWTGEIKEGLWKCLCHLLYDKTSIDNTYTSNHSLHTLLMGNWSNDDVIPNDITYLLKRNEQKDKVKVAICTPQEIEFL